jgi:hypothetical protein
VVIEKDGCAWVGRRGRWREAGRHWGRGSGVKEKQGERIFGETQ